MPIDERVTLDLPSEWDVGIGLSPDGRGAPRPRADGALRQGDEGARVVTTRIQIKAVPFGAAIHLTRRALALGPTRFTHRRVLELMGDWWEAGRAGWDCADRAGRILAGADHPFTFALRILEQPQA